MSNPIAVSAVILLFSGGVGSVLYKRKMAQITNKANQDKDVLPYTDYQNCISLLKQYSFINNGNLTGNMNQDFKAYNNNELTLDEKKTFLRADNCRHITRNFWKTFVKLVPFEGDYIVRQSYPEFLEIVVPIEKSVHPYRPLSVYSEFNIKE